MKYQIKELSDGSYVVKINGCETATVSGPMGLVVVLAAIENLSTEGQPNGWSWEGWMERAEKFYD